MKKTRRDRAEGVQSVVSDVSDWMDDYTRTMGDIRCLLIDGRYYQACRAFLRYVRELKSKREAASESQ